MMDDLEAKFEGLHLASSFKVNSVGNAVRDKVVSHWNVTAPEARAVVLQQLKLVSSFVDQTFRENAFTHAGEMNRWFALAEATIEALSVKAEEWKASFPVLTDEEMELLEQEEAKQERIWELEEQGAYGRTVAFEEGSADWIFLRFGDLPKSKRSICGIVIDEAEDYANGWREELGNMTHESGISIFRGYRHPSHPDNYVLLDPHYDLARYHVGGLTSHLLAIIPHVDDLSEIKMMKINGSLKTIKGLDGTLRCDLGSDGEYLLDGFKPHDVQEIALDTVWVSEKENVADFLRRCRNFDSDTSMRPGI